MSVAVPLTTNNFQKTDVGALATGNAWASSSWWQDFIQSRPATMSNDPDFNVLLLNVAGSNDKAALATLFRHFAPRLKSLMLRLGTDFHTAEELAQEAMLSVWRKSQMFDPTRASASTWIFTIARNLRIDRFRNESRPELDPKDPALVREPDLPADDQLAVKDRQVAVRECVAALPEEQREAVHLSFVEGLSHQEISDQLGLPLGTVKSRLRLSFSKLRPMLRNVS
jgi:RNA polymerase sigma-70 factor (ECF subfamily)